MQMFAETESLHAVTAIPYSELAPLSSAESSPSNSWMGGTSISGSTGTVNKMLYQGKEVAVKVYKIHGFLKPEDQSLRCVFN